MSAENFKVVHSFKNIEIYEKTLIVCDIDDTLLRYELSWQHFFLKHKEQFNNNEIAESYANTDWYFYTASNKCFFVDKEGFEIFMNKIKETNSQIIFLTARSPISHNYTIENFNDLGLVHTEFDIHYSYMKPKGKYLHEQIYELGNYDISEFKKIIFIDDAYYNILNMNMVLPDVECYFFLGSPNGHSQITFL